MIWNLVRNNECIFLGKKDRANSLTALLACRISIANIFGIAIHKVLKEEAENYIYAVHILDDSSPPNVCLIVWYSMQYGMINSFTWFLLELFWAWKLEHFLSAIRIPFRISVDSNIFIRVLIHFDDQFL